jgi:hypothetical protein
VALEWRRTKLPVGELTGDEIRSAARLEEEDEVARAVKRMKNLRRNGYL